MSKKALTAREIQAKAACEKAGTDLKKAPNSGRAMRLAVFRYIADELGAEPGSDERKAAWTAFSECPISFGSNASAFGQRAFPDLAATSEIEEDVMA